VRCIRVSKHRYAKEVAFEDRLTDHDRLLLQVMGIAL
jgi:hypothetical protein